MNAHDARVRTVWHMLHLTFAPKGGVFWPNPTVGYYDAGRGIYRKPHNSYKGPADVLGVLPHPCGMGVHVEIEIKTGSGRQEAAQIEHQRRVEAAGGVYLLDREKRDQVPVWERLRIIYEEWARPAPLCRKAIELVPRP